MDLIKVIEKDIKSKKDKYCGEKYYSYKPKNHTNDNTIDVVDGNGNIKSIELNTNNSCVYVNHYRLLVDQKIDYLLSQEPTLQENIFDQIELTSMLEDIMIKASNCGRSWVYLYIENSKIEYDIVHDCEIIPQFKKRKLVSLIRYYLIDDDTYKVEYWETNKLSISTIKKDKITSSYSIPHFIESMEYDGNTIKEIPKFYNVIPFVPLNNNKLIESDIDQIENLIEFYNSISSGFIDNIYKFQEAIVKLTGFTADGKTLKETMDNLKKYKIVGIPDDGNIDYLAIEIPVEARQVILDLLKTNIYKIGRGFDNDQIGDGNITNIVIKSRYTYLQSKCNGFEKQVKLFYKQFVDVINTMSRNNYNYDIVFNKTILINETETIDNCVKSMGLVSKETILSNHPWVKDAKKELKLLEDEESKEAEKFKDHNENMENKQNFDMEIDKKTETLDSM